MPIEFRSLRAVVLDMDGVLWRSASVLPGVPDFFEFAQQHGITYAFATNNSTKTVDSYLKRLGEVGIPTTADQVITSSVATADYMRRRYPVETPVYIIGQDGIRQALAACGYREDPQNAQVVVVGLDFDIRFERLKTATLRIRAGADFIGTNGDLTFPTPEGLVPGNGSLLALLQAATGVIPTVIGKPETAMFEITLSRLGATPEQTVMIGDRLSTDILGAQRAGLKTALVLTGVTSAEEARTADIQADCVFESLAAIQAAWAAALA